MHKHNIFIKVLILVHQWVGNITQLTDFRYLLPKKIYTYVILCKEVCSIFSCRVTFYECYWIIFHPLLPKTWYSNRSWLCASKCKCIHACRSAKMHSFSGTLWQVALFVIASLAMPIITAPVYVFPSFLLIRLALAACCNFSSAWTNFKMNLVRNV